MFEYNGIKFTGHRNWTAKELKMDFSKIVRKLHWFNLVDNYNYDEFYKAAEAAGEVFDIYSVEDKKLKIVPVANSFTYIKKPNGAADFITA